jgi:hypothetical protein
MDKYSDYFFDEPWQENYDYERATTFTKTDQAFLNVNREFEDRLQTVLLKKNIHLHGFQGVIGMMWTQQSYSNETQETKEE